MLPPTIVYPGGGIFFWWQAGCVAGLKRRFDLRSGHVKAVGASAGALSAALGTCHCDMDRALSRAIALTDEAGCFSRGVWGLYGVWGDMITTWLDDLLPDDAAEACRGRVSVAVTAVPRVERLLIDDFTDRGDLINTLKASIHVPLFLDRQWTSELRGAHYVDGSLMEALRPKRYLLGPRDARSPILRLYHGDDPRMAARFTRNDDFLRLSSPDGVAEMMGWGEEHVEALDARGELSVLDGIRWK